MRVLVLCWLSVTPKKGSNAPDSQYKEKSCSLAHGFSPWPLALLPGPVVRRLVMAHVGEEAAFLLAAREQREPRGGWGPSIP